MESESFLENIQRRFNECVTMMETIPRPPPENLYCSRVFDAWTCWNDTPAGDTAYARCPDFIEGFDPHRFAHKDCLPNGTWFVHPESGKPWSNYTNCIDLEDLKLRKAVNTVYVIGYSISFVALIVSLFIFFYFRSLKCTRILIHKHLFTSFLMNNLMWLIWYVEVVDDPETVKGNGIFCQALHFLVHYFMVANYFWMFCEGLHLHLALVVVFVKDEIVMRWFYFIGWALPLIITGIYALARGSVPEETIMCWIKESHYTWILSAPVCLSMLASLVFLVNVVVVLLTKLHSNSANPAPVGMKKAVRATLILIPLFGIHYILIPFRPDVNSPGEAIYQFFSAFVSSLQGVCVSCLFCFANGDVHSAVRSLFHKIFPPTEFTSNTQYNTHTRDVCV